MLNEPLWNHYAHERKIGIIFSSVGHTVYIEKYIYMHRSVIHTRISFSINSLYTHLFFFAFLRPLYVHFVSFSHCLLFSLIYFPV